MPGAEEMVLDVYRSRSKSGKLNKQLGKGLRGDAARQRCWFNFACLACDIWKSPPSHHFCRDVLRRCFLHGAPPLLLLCGRDANPIPVGCRRGELRIEKDTCPCRHPVPSAATATAETNAELF